MGISSFATIAARHLGRRLALYRDRRTAFRHDLAICAIFKDEARYLDEWLTFHAGVGVEHFYLYDDASSDGFREVLRPWMRGGRVTLVSWDGRNQTTAYNHCLRRVRMDTRWLAFIDIDEFLFAPRHPDLRTALGGYADVPAVFVYWVLFGSAGHGARPAGPVLEAYTRCLPPAAAAADTFDHRHDAGRTEYVTGWAHDGKSIVNPRLVRTYAVHKPQALWRGETLDENRQPPRHRAADCRLSVDVLRINHYWSKSLEDLAAKVGRGSVCDRTRPQRTPERWQARERLLNVADDTTILPLWRSILARSAAVSRAA